eukprot:Gregarina_sp_Poly_1__8543@NODE_5059_length_422_cov_2_721127_g3552_i0_p1_GENE_NODE_5059_length_422_cov_2_721127_g3552_i0NODE_5059_length_422_cov_2_721127_g3552_i0_p1_ORF_typecomplete_len101_score10_83TBD/PF12845_7/0_11_NODE_5059_length_422_cov_2_721127_g3552_i015317
MKWQKRQNQSKRSEKRLLETLKTDMEFIYREGLSAGNDSIFELTENRLRSLTRLQWKHLRELNSHPRLIQLKLFRCSHDRAKYKRNFQVLDAIRRIYIIW